jgi:hypothetical protein
MHWLQKVGPVWIELDRNCVKGEEIVVDYPWSNEDTDLDDE